MTGSRRRYLSSAVGLACGLLLALAIVEFLERFGSDPLSGGFTNGEVDLEIAAGPSPGLGGESAVMSLHDTPRPLAELRFEDGSGRPLTLVDFRGKVVLLNIWATWCGPCRREMPTLDRLQATLGGPDFEVVALSIDRAGIGVVTEFYDEIGIEHLAKYIDESGKSAQQLNAVGLPTTLLIDREGREIGRHVGPAEWDTPEMVAFLEQQVTRTSGASLPGRASKRAGGPTDRPLAPNALPRTLRPLNPAPPVAEGTISSAINEEQSS